MSHSPPVRWALVVAVAFALLRSMGEVAWADETAASLAASTSFPLPAPPDELERLGREIARAKAADVQLKRRLGWALIGAGIPLVAGGVTMGVVAVAGTISTNQDLGLLLGAVLTVGAGAAMIIVGDGELEPGRRASWVVAPSAHGIMAALAGRF